MIKGLFEAKRWNALFQVFPEKYIPGFMMTLKVALTGLLLALVLGIIFGMLSTSKAKICRFFSRVYVEFFQNTPLVVQVFFYYNCLPYVIGGRVPKFMLGVLGVGIYHGAYISEVIRTGIEAVPKGQFEAAYSQGFTYLQTMRYVSDRGYFAQAYFSCALLYFVICFPLARLARYLEIRAKRLPVPKKRKEVA